MTHSKAPQLRSQQHVRHDAAWLAAILAAFSGLAFLFACYVVSGDDEQGFVVYGQLVTTGQIRLYQDDMLGYRLPLPFYVNGLPQLLVGKSLLAPRLLSIALGGGMLVVLFALGRCVASSVGGFLAVLLVATNGMLLGYYARASYFSLSALLIVAGLLAIAHHRPFLGMLLFALLAITRAHLAVLVPAVLVYLLVAEARTMRDRAALVAIAVAPALTFFAWSQEHWKVLAYVPVARRLVEPLGYRSLFDLGAIDLAANPGPLDWLTTFVRRYVFWVAATVAVGAAWLALSRPRPPKIVLLSTGLCLWAVACSVVIIPRFATSVAAWAVTFAPLWALVLAWGAAVAFDRGRRTFRIALAVILGLVFAVAPYRARNPSMPIVLPPMTTPAAYAAQAAIIKAAVPVGERVFLVADPLPAWLAGVRLHLQQVVPIWMLVPSEDQRAVSRSGVWGPRDLEEWLGEARYAIIDESILEGYRQAERYRPLANRMEAVLRGEFIAVADCGRGPVGLGCRIYRRRS